MPGYAAPSNHGGQLSSYSSESVPVSNFSSQYFYHQGLQSIDTLDKRQDEQFEHFLGTK